MTIKDAAKVCFQKYIVFSGRASREEFWKFIMFLFGVHVVLLFVNSLAFGPSIEEGIRVTRTLDGTQTTTPFRNVSYTGGWFANIFTLITILPLLAVAWRRLHDRSRTGLWALVPYGFLFAMAAVWFLTGESVPAGTDPQTGEVVNVILPSSLALVFIPGVLSVISSILLFVWLCSASDPTHNKFGPNPTEVPS